MAMRFALLWWSLACGVLGSTKAQQLSGNFTPQRLLNNHTRVKPPPPTDIISEGSTVVAVYLTIHSMGKFDMVTMSYDVQITILQKWKDSRLAWDNSSYAAPFISISDRNEIWFPDTIIQNEKRSQRHGDVIIRVAPDGIVSYAERLTLTLGCPMDLRLFPIDVQQCHLELTSFDKDIVFILWPLGKLDEMVGPWLPPFRLLDLRVTQFQYPNGTGRPSKTQTATFDIQRLMSYYVLQVFLPSAMLVAVSWLSFWLDRSAVSARVGLGVSTLLTLAVGSTIYNFINFPLVDYIKLLDVWIGVCLFFIFATLAEFALVCCVAERQAKKSDAYSAIRAESKPNAAREEENLLSNPSMTTDKAKSIDTVSRIVFPVAFLTFITIYWIACIYKSYTMLYRRRN